MFEIEYKGGNSLVISTKNSRMIIDPKRSLFGAKDLPSKATVELVTEDRFSVDVDGLLIHLPGEYEVGDFSIRGVAARRHIDTEADGENAVMYRIEIGDVKIGLLGNIDKSLSEDQLEELGVLDILVLPVGGGGYTLDGTDASNLTRRIEPKAVIPVHYADGDLAYEVPQDDLSTFVSELGAPVEKLVKYKLKAPAALPQVLTIVELDRN